MAVEIVLTERKVDLTTARAENYARLSARVRDASADDVHVAHYEEIELPRLEAASSIVLSGSSAPWSSHDPDDLGRLGDAIRAAGRPVLGICAGMQLQAMFAGGRIGTAQVPERGFCSIRVHDQADLLRGLPDEIVVFQDHTDEVIELPPGFRVLASSAECSVQAIAAPERRWWGTQFHPEESRPEHPAGDRILRTFFALAA